MKRVLVLCHGDPMRAPRPNRMIGCLKTAYRVTVAAPGPYDDPDVDHVALDKRRKRPSERLAGLVNLLLQRFEACVWTTERRRLAESLGTGRFDVVVCHNIELLPVARRVAGEGKVFFDAKEYYPGQYDERFGWKLLHRRLAEYLCRRYMPLSDHTVTVSPGISERYRKEFGVEAEVLYSFPTYQELAPSPVSDKRVRLIHHGNANPTRRIEEMIDAMDEVDDRFTLDLMLTKTSSRYYESLVRRASRSDRVRLIPPVAPEDIVSFINEYDVGLYNAHPANFNMRHMLPNKLFEFIQARLALVIGPSVEMKRFVERYDVGVVAGGFDPSAIAGAINALTVDDIDRYKRNSDAAARELSSESNCKRVHAIVSGLCAAGERSRRHGERSTAAAPPRPVAPGQDARGARGG